MKAVQEDCAHILLSLTCTPRCLHLLVTNDCLLTITRLLVNTEREGGGRDNLRQLLIHIITQPSVIMRYTDQIREVISLLAIGFKDNQVYIYNTL